VLIAGERGGIHAKTVFQAFGIAFVYKFLMTALKVWQEYPGKVFRSYQGAEVRVEASPELIGVGYIIGPRIAAISSRRLPCVCRADAGDQVVRQRHDRADVRHDQADPRYVRR